MKISLHIVTWNHGSIISRLLDSVAAQTRPPDEIIIVDNASTDDTIRKIRSHPLRVHLIEEPNNTGFSGGHNTAVKHSTSDVVILCNPDIRLDPNTLWAVERAWGRHPDAGIIIGEMRRDDELVDTLGIEMLRGFRFYNRAEGRPRRPSAEQSVWGANGGFLTISRSTIEAVSWNGEFLDAHMIAYKDDVDLSWRVQSLGRVIWFDPLIQLQHDRAIRRKPSRFQWLASVRSHRTHRKLIRFYSYRNHLWTIIKNAALGDVVRQLPWLLLYEGSKAVYLLFTSPAILARAWVDTAHELPRLLAFRRSRL